MTPPWWKSITNQIKPLLGTALNTHIIIWAEQTLWYHDCEIMVLFDSFEIL